MAIFLQHKVYPFLCDQVPGPAIKMDAVNTYSPPPPESFAQRENNKNSCLHKSASESKRGTQKTELAFDEWDQLDMIYNHLGAKPWRMSVRLFFLLR